MPTKPCDCPCVRSEHPVAPCGRSCWHFTVGGCRGYCQNCLKGEPPDAASLYRIKPLNWQCARPAGHEDGEWWSAESVFGSVNVEQDFCDGQTYGTFHWRYCFDEFYDEGRHDCESIADGKAKAEEFVRNRLLTALEPMETPRS